MCLFCNLVHDYTLHDLLALLVKMLVTTITSVYMTLLYIFIHLTYVKHQR